MHHKFEPGLNFKWYGQDVLIILLVITVTAYFSSNLLAQSESRWELFTTTFVIGIFALLSGIVAASFARIKIRTWLVMRQENQGY